LWDPFAKKLDSGLFLQGDFVHPNKKGNEIIAESIHKRLFDEKVQ